MLCYTVTMRTTRRRDKAGLAQPIWTPSLQVCPQGVNSRKAGKGGRYEIRILGDAFEEIIAYVSLINSNSTKQYWALCADINLSIF